MLKNPGYETCRLRARSLAQISLREVSRAASHTELGRFNLGSAFSPADQPADNAATSGAASADFTLVVNTPLGGHHPGNLVRQPGRLSLGMYAQD